MAEDECCVIPKNANDGVEVLANNSCIGQREQSLKSSASEDVGKISSRLSTSRKKRNERIAEHVACSPRGCHVKTGSAGEEQQRVRRSQPIKKSTLNLKNSQESVIEDRKIEDEHTRRSIVTRNSVNKKASVRSPVEDNSSVNMKTPDNCCQRHKKIVPLKSLNHTNGKGSQESVVENGGCKLSRSRTPTRNSLNTSRAMNGRGSHESGSSLKSGVLNGRENRSPGSKKPVSGSRRPPSGIKKFSGVCKVSWSELAEASLITKPSSLLTTGRAVLYKDLNQLLEDSRNIHTDGKVRRLLHHVLPVNFNSRHCSKPGGF
jgi:hypothetical protein